MNRKPLLTQYGISSNGSIVFNNNKHSNRTITGVCQIGISDSNDALSPDTLTILSKDKQGSLHYRGIHNPSPLCRRIQMELEQSPLRFHTLQRRRQQ